MAVAAAELMEFLEQIKNESVQLVSIPVAKLFEHLKSSREGLTSLEAQARITVLGPNKVQENKESEVLKFLGFMWNPLSCMMEAAAIMAIALANGGHRPPDWQDFVGIIALLLINSTICYVAEKIARRSTKAALMANPVPKAKVLRDGRWSKQDAAILVPGDIISIKLGDIVPADARLLLGGDPIKIDESTVARATGEPRAVNKNAGDIVYSGSTCKRGEAEAVVIATGVHSLLGRMVYHVRNSDTTSKVGHLPKVLSSIGDFCIAAIVVGMIVEIIVMYFVQHRRYRDGIENLLALLISGIPIAMPTVLSVTMAIGSHRLSLQGAVTKRMSAIEDMAAMTVLCCDKAGTLTLNKLTVYRNLIEVFAKGVDREAVILLAARASRVEDQDAVDFAMVAMLADPQRARAGIQKVHFLPFNPVDKRTALTYVDLADGKWHRVSKGAPEQILELCNCDDDAKINVRAVVNKLAGRGLRSIAVARQEVPEKYKLSPGTPWELVGVVPLLDPPRHDTAATIQRARSLGVSVKMITGDQLAIAKETGRRLGMGTNMYPFSGLFGQKWAPVPTLPMDDELVDEADGFFGAFPAGYKYNVITRLQQMKHVCGMTGDGVHDVTVVRLSNIGIAAAGANDAAKSASDIVFTEPGLSVIISAVLTSRAIFQRMKNYTVYAMSITASNVFGFTLITLIWKLDISPFMILVIAVLNNGTVMTIAVDRVEPSPHPESWKPREILVASVVYGAYLSMTTVVFFWAMSSTDLFTNTFHVRSLRGDEAATMSALYLQVSTISQALVFVTRSRGWCFLERPRLWMCLAFILSQMIATLLAVYANNLQFARISGIGWGWARVIWFYSLIAFIPLDWFKFFIRYLLSREKVMSEPDREETER